MPKGAHGPLKLLSTELDKLMDHPEETENEAVRIRNPD